MRGIRFAPGALDVVPVGPAPPAVATDEGPERGRFGRHHLLEQPVEEQPTVPRAAAVEAEGELVEVIVELVRLDRSLVGAEQPALE